MRYYSVIITKADGTPYRFKSLGNIPLTSLLPSGSQNPMTGQANPAALNVEFDMTASVFDAPDNNPWLRVWGLGLADIGSAANLTGLNVAVYGGMSKGLPLANPAQAGLLIKGQILAAWGNWIGTDQTVDMVFSAGVGVGGPDAPANFPFFWAAGTPLKAAIAQTLSTALPGLTQDINISPSLVLNYDVSGYYQSASQFADFIKELSVGIPVPGGGTIDEISGGGYSGVKIVTNGQAARVFDGTTPTAASGIGQVAYQDLIGQPTWIAGGTISMKTILRADIHVGDTITIPPSLVTTASLAAAQFNAGLAKSKTTFSGEFLVNQVHHYGNFRQADAASWATVFQLAANIKSAPPPDTASS